MVQRRWSWPGPNKRPVYNFRSEGREFSSNRCLIVADGFYEFTDPIDPKKKRKDKWLFTKENEPIFCIAGIWRDTPEVGECGDDEAAAVLRRLVDGRRVTLVAGASQDRDRYGRLLRYVEVDGVDANLVLLQRGRAIARYDSRDGYGPHAREGAYIAADRASPTANVCAAPAAPSTILAPGAPDGSDPRFGACHDAVANGYGPYVAGRDPEYDWYGDADGDGVNCE